METIVIIVLVLIALYVAFRIFKAIIKWLIIGIVIIVAIAFFSNPDESSHMKSLREITRNLPVKIEDNALQVNDYKVFSIAKVKVNGTEETVGIGAFGKVWYFDEMKELLK